MISEHVDAATAGHRVGYESQSQFNRECSRLFGSPPARDVKRLHERPTGSEIANAKTQTGGATPSRRFRPRSRNSASASCR